jgi:hypothetical protein
MAGAVSGSGETLTRASGANSFVVPVAWASTNQWGGQCIKGPPLRLRRNTAPRNITAVLTVPTDMPPNTVLPNITVLTVPTDMLPNTVLLRWCTLPLGGKGRKGKTLRAPVKSSPQTFASVRAFDRKLARGSEQTAISR